MSFRDRRQLALAAALEVARQGSPLHLDQIAAMVGRRHPAIVSDSSVFAVKLEIAQNRFGYLDKLEPGVYRSSLPAKVLARELERVVEVARQEEEESRAERAQNQTRRLDHDADLDDETGFSGWSSSPSWFVEAPEYRPLRKSDYRPPKTNADFLELIENDYDGAPIWIESPSQAEEEPEDDDDWEGTDD